MDVESMTTNDWLGVFFSVFVFVAMIYVYFMVFRPANKDKFESQRSMALDDEDLINSGDKK
jgi:cbb3-type cytochrome oxidase subunit 3